MALAPVMPGAPSRYFRVDPSRPLPVLLHELSKEGMLRSVTAVRILALITRHHTNVATGTYRLGPGMTGAQVLSSLDNPVHQMVRIPDTNWAARNARVLAAKSVCDPDDYLSVVNHPGNFGGRVSFPLPDGSLEGYLFPDTYDLPPLLGGQGVVERQLRAFERKVWDPLGHPRELHRLLTVASLVELEVARDNERPLVAAVIENRLKKHMKLQIDASINYALKVWRPLHLSDLKQAKGPYNLYTHAGLPPGPICSPSLKSIRAAMEPAHNTFLYYVAMPDGHSLFASTYEEHLKNIKLRKAALATLRKHRQPKTGGHDETEVAQP